MPFVTWFKIKLNHVGKPVDRSRWTFTLVTTLLPTKLFAWRSSTVCAAALASRPMCASCSTRSGVVFYALRTYIWHFPLAFKIKFQLFGNTPSVFWGLSLCSILFLGLLRRSSSQLTAREFHYADPLLASTY